MHLLGSWLPVAGRAAAEGPAGTSSLGEPEHRARHDHATADGDPYPEAAKGVAPNRPGLAARAVTAMGAAG
jgi:hypothetical protein